MGAKVSGGGFKKERVITKSTQALIAASAEQLADSACLVAVVNGKITDLASVGGNFGTLADSTDAALCKEHGIVVGSCESVFVLPAKVTVFDSSGSQVQLVGLLGFDGLAGATPCIKRWLSAVVQVPKKLELRGGKDLLALGTLLA